ncbi:hypothetical protein I9W82_004405 [Candida metapsilosis]|uniref:UPF3 domain-containing protein n=1 Tax=Candida metapsilosis TaxID=273372 RepID=A0A8H7ZDQ7_9ASCO|nr:hypothetical protein I9W82_004405 [Candida metapsilosis]
MASIAPTRNSETTGSPTTTIKRNAPAKHSSEGINSTTPTSKPTIGKKSSKGGPEHHVKYTMRLLPPGLKEHEFLNQLANIYPHHATKIQSYYFVQGFYPSTPFELPIYSRAYVSFRNANDSLEFCSFVKNKPFQDEKDSIIPIVEKSVFQKMIKSKGLNDLKVESKADKNSNRLEDDEIYKKFLLYLEKGLENFDLKKIHKSLNKKNKEKQGKGQPEQASKRKKNKKSKESEKAKDKDKEKQKKPKAKTKQNSKEKEGVKKTDKHSEEGKGSEKGKENDGKKRKRNRKPRSKDSETKSAGDDTTNNKDASKKDKPPSAEKATENKKDASGASKSRQRQRNRKKGRDKKEDNTTKKEVDTTKDKPAPKPKEFKPIKILSKKANQGGDEANSKN